MRFILFIVIILIYIISINFTFNYDEIRDRVELKNNLNSSIESQALIDISMSDSVSILVTRKRWYGTIHEFGGKDYLVGYLQPFNIKKINIPTLKNKVNYLQIHVYFLLFLISLYLIFKIIDIRRLVKHGNLETY